MTSQNDQQDFSLKNKNTSNFHFVMSKQQQTELWSNATIQLVVL